MTRPLQRLGIIQSRGLGDIVIALPIAHHYHRNGWEIHWPICREFLPHFEHTVPWVNWHTVTTDPGSFFLEQPRDILNRIGIDQELCLYQALTNQDFHTAAWFQYTKFDQYKYIRAGVNFLEKWQLAQCITRNREREQELYHKIVRQDRYCVMHLEGSDHRAEFDRSVIPRDWQQIEITGRETLSIFDWITVLERAEAIVCVDSVFSNLVDQLSIDSDLYLIPRSHIGLTPVYAQNWQWLEKSDHSTRS